MTPRVPSWLVLTGPPASGKTQLIHVLQWQGLERKVSVAIIPLCSTKPADPAIRDVGTRRYLSSGQYAALAPERWVILTEGKGSALRVDAIDLEAVTTALAAYDLVVSVVRASMIPLLERHPRVRAVRHARQARIVTVFVSPVADASAVESEQLVKVLAERWLARAKVEGQRLTSALLTDCACRAREGAEQFAYAADCDHQLVLEELPSSPNWMNVPPTGAALTRAASELFAFLDL